MAHAKLYDPNTGKLLDLDRLIIKMGVREIAKKYEVTEATVHRWRKGAQKPSLKSISKSLKRFI